MGFGNLDNCPRCGKLYVATKEVCPACEKGIEEEYQRCIDYLRDNKLVNIYVLSEEVDVTVKQIKKFIQQGRISVAEFSNMKYPCESCGTEIYEGKLCASCRERLEKGIKKALVDKSNEDKSKEEKKKDSTGGYYHLKDRF